MELLTGRGGGWWRSAVMAVWLALAVLVHHAALSGDLSAGAPVAHSMAMAGVAGRASPASTSAPRATVDRTDPSARAASAHRDGSGGAGACAVSGMQVCTTASVDTVSLAVPVLGRWAPIADLFQVVAGPVPGAPVGRAPPDLSVLSRLRI